VLEGDALISLQAEALEKCRALAAAWTKLNLIPDPALHSRSVLDGSTLMLLLQGDAAASKAAKAQANRRHEVAATAMKAIRNQTASASSRAATPKEARDKSGNANKEEVVRLTAHVISAEGLVALDKGKELHGDDWYSAWLCDSFIPVSISLALFFHSSSPPCCQEVPQTPILH